MFAINGLFDNQNGQFTDKGDINCDDVADQGRRRSEELVERPYPRDQRRVPPLGR